MAAVLVMTYCNPLRSMSIGPLILRYSFSKFDHENPWSKPCVWSKVKVKFAIENSKVKVMAEVKPIGHIWGLEFNRYVRFSSVAIGPFWARYSKFNTWAWKLKVKVMAKVKPDGHIWGLEINQYVCFLFRCNRIICGWDMANSIFDLENSRSRAWSRSNLMVTF